MRKYKKEVLIPTGEYQNEKIGVEFDFDDDKKPVDAWFEVDEAIKFQKDLIQQELEMNTHFQTKPKVPVTPQTPPPSTTYTATPAIAPSSPTTEAKMCPIHSVPLENKVSKKTGKPYTGHSLAPGSMCFGKPQGYSI